MDYIKTSKIKFNENYERFRKDMGSIPDLATSIQKFGQIQPIVITKDFELVAGGRRLAACLFLKKDIAYVFIDDLSEIDKRLIELEENIQRLNFSPAEEALAIEELHRLKQKEFGVAVPGQRGGWKLEDTAKKLGKSAQTISRSLDVAKAVRQNPILMEAKTKQEIQSSIRGKRKIIEKALALAKRVNDPILKEVNEIVSEGDWLGWIQRLPNNSVDVIITDPPYGMDVHKQTAGSIGQTGFKFKDDFQYAQFLYSELAKESFRVGSNLSHAIVFCSGQLLNYATEEFRKAGWLVWNRPIVWIKADSGQSNNPSMWPASCSEFAIFCRQEKSSIENFPMPDWVQFPPLLGEKRTHPTEKPLKLMKWILNYVGFKGAKVIDPFAGSYSSIQAAIDMDMNAQGCDLAPECKILGTVRVADALDRRVKRHKKEQDNG